MRELVENLGGNPSQSRSQGFCRRRKTCRNADRSRSSRQLGAENEPGRQTDTQVRWLSDTEGKINLVRVGYWRALSLFR